MRNKDVIELIYRKIEEAPSVMLFRHQSIDGDCTGAAMGLKAIIQAAWPEKRVLIIDDEKSDFLAFLGPADEDVPDEIYRESLGIAVDTANGKRIANQKYRLCRELIKIDHHIEVEAYGNINWVEDDRSSACEMIAAFVNALKDRLTLTKEAARYLYLGMVTDSGRFKYEGVKGETMRLAAMLLDTGIDLETLYAHLYLKDFSSLRLRSYIYENMQKTENGVLHAHITKSLQDELSLTFESACAAISYMEGVKDCLVWILFIDSPDYIRVRLRSRFTTVNEIAEKYRGGGHANASGATVYNKEEIENLLKDADEWVKEYKHTHEGWM
ncbi:MAG: bifunctional oligoribonuclease/PAP phosphatase NrnA [Clostridia bacterium]|nr:bifunctional oligoribonuclease/PAP phosphatase NrnA [Clostridia bacterium]